MLGYNVGTKLYTLDWCWCNLFRGHGKWLGNMGTCLHFVIISNYTPAGGQSYDI